MLYYLQKTSRLPTLDSAMNLALRGTLVNEDLPKSKTNGEEGVLAGCYSIQLIFQKHPEGLPECVCVWFHIKAQAYFWASSRLWGVDMLCTVNSLMLWPFQLLTTEHAVSLNRKDSGMA